MKKQLVAGIAEAVQDKLKDSTASGEAAEKSH
jgi:hypothetical protein